MAPRFTREHLDSLHGTTVDDLIGDHVRLLFVGINPGLWTAAVNAHFARRGNRFWPALHAAGITPRLVEASDGMRPDDTAMLHELGIGITNVVPTASAGAAQLSLDEVRAGGAALVAKVERLQPKVVAVLGLTVYRQAFDRPKARQGEQEERLGGARCFVLPNPSGLNASYSLSSLAGIHRTAWDAAQG